MKSVDIRTDVKQEIKELVAVSYNFSPKPGIQAFFFN